MLQRIIEFSLKNKFIIVLSTMALVLGGIYAVKNIPLDAIPDLSDVQVIVYTEWPGQAPQIVQDQVTYPITTKMLSVPKAKAVRGYSFYGFSFVYILLKTPPMLVGPSCIPSPPRTAIWPNCAPCRIGISATNWPRWKAFPRWPLSEASSSNTRSPWTRPNCALTTSPSRKSPWRSNAATAKWADARSNFRKRNSSSAYAVTCNSSRI